MSVKQLSPASIHLLIEALTYIYWYKRDLKTFLYESIQNRQFVDSLDWSLPKRQIVSELIEKLSDRPRSHPDLLVKICEDVIGMQSFEHLEQLDNGAQLATKATKAVVQLRRAVKSHQDSTKEKQATIKRSRDRVDQQNKIDKSKIRLKELHTEFSHIAIEPDHQKRGFDLEKFMPKLFSLFGLESIGSFKIKGEQIDGAFSMEGTEYLFEAKWQTQLVGAPDLDVFSAKVKRKLENTLGLFLSMSGFIEEGINTHTKSDLKIILMDGSDLMTVLEDRISFLKLISLKKQHAARTGDIFLAAARTLR